MISFFNMLQLNSIITEYIGVKKSPFQMRKNGEDKKLYLSLEYIKVLSLKIDVYFFYKCKFFSFQKKLATYMKIVAISHQ